MKAVSRRTFIGASAALATMFGTGCVSGQNAHEGVAGAKVSTSIPDADPDESTEFKTDKHINIQTIDAYLDREDVAYRDMRMVYDPADYESIGGESNISLAIRGFKIAPWPYIASLSVLPVKGAYAGPSLYHAIYDGFGNLVDAEPNFEESEEIVEDLFPRDKKLFIMCGAGGYAASTCAFLKLLGWDERKIYNLGGAWDYEGDNGVAVARHKNGGMQYRLWRLDVANINDFDSYTALSRG